MSIHVMTWVFRESTAKLGDRLVLLILADKADDDGTNARPSVPTIAQQACLSERQVQRCLGNLKEAGLIEQTGRYRYPGQNHGVNVYRVIMDNMSPLNGSKGDIHDIPRVTPTSPNPSLEQPKEQLLAAAPRPSDYKKITDTVRKSNEAMKKIKPPPRARNPVWDALTEVFGEPTTPGAVKVRGKVCAGLTAARADPSEVVRRARSWPAHFDGATMTDLALEKHWDTLGRKPLRRRS